AGTQVEEVVAADRWRNDQEWPLPDGGGARPVLDQLRDVVPVDDIARGDGEVDAHGKGRAVGLRRHAAVVPDVVRELAHAPYETRPARVERAFQRRGVGGQG